VEICLSFLRAVLLHIVSKEEAERVSTAFSPKAEKRIRIFGWRSVSIH
jgi:hypothetical protein